MYTIVYSIENRVRDYRVERACSIMAMDASWLASTPGRCCAARRIPASSVVRVRVRVRVR